jgi:large subunit ribosomal protein L23
MSLFGAKKTIEKGKTVTTTKSEGADNKKVSKKVLAKKTTKKEAPKMQDLYNTSDSKTPTTKTKDGKKLAVNSNFKTAYKVLVKPLVTEKATHLGSINKYVFVVDKRANKISVARSIQAIYGVKPTQVNIMNMSGKKVSKGKVRGKRKDWRKAIVTLKAGENIKIYEGV